jgi:alkylation response protein AidB-like acyl-CoA dehydrogenase
MDVRSTPEQRALRATAAQVASRLGPQSVGALGDAERAAKLDAAVEATGWRELRTPNDSGAPWASAVEVAVVAEELARGLADTAFLGPTLAADLRRLAGAPEAGVRETVALRPDLAGPAAPDEPAVAIDVGGAAAALLLLNDGTVRAVELVTETGPTGVDLTRPTRCVSGLPGELVGALDDDAVRRWTALALAATTADLVGTMQGALDLAVGYAGERSQYGAPIGSFQAVGHMLAEALVHLEGSRTALLHAAWAVDALEPADALAAAASAKAYAARAAREVCEIAIQVHGGIGHTWECLAHLHLRRSLLATDVLGGVGPNLARVLAHAGVAPGGRAA